MDERQIGAAYIGFLIFSLFMTFGSLAMSKILFAILCFVDLLFIGLSLNAFGISPVFTLRLSGYFELIISLLSFYGSAASVLNNTFQQVVLPVGKPFDIFRKTIHP
jgi:hypothetical protein